jgi:hypothetical protein
MSSLVSVEQKTATKPRRRASKNTIDGGYPGRDRKSRIPRENAFFRFARGVNEREKREQIMAKLTKPTRDRISATKFAFPKQRKEPLENASHVRNAAARFDQVEGVTEAERRAAWKRIESAAKKYGVELRKSA